MDCDPLASRPGLIEALRQEVKADLLSAYKQMENLARRLDHDLREEQTKTVLLLNVLAQLRDNPSAVAERVDRLLGRVGDRG
jgi:hypothetical protein